jgi:hypothetical protein
VAVNAISVNPVDVKLRASASPPKGEVRVLGFDAAGIVSAIGSAVTLFKPGDEVFYAGAIDRPGTNSEAHVVDERVVGHKPKTLSFTQAAALPLTTGVLAVATAAPAGALKVSDTDARALTAPQNLIVAGDITAARRAPLLRPVDAFYGFWVNGSAKLLEQAVSPSFFDHAGETNASHISYRLGTTPICWRKDR